MGNLDHSSPRGRGVTALMWANFALLVAILFGTGVFYQRVNEIEAKVKAIQSTDTITVQIIDIKAEVSRQRDRLERLIESGRPSKTGEYRQGEAHRYTQPAPAKEPSK